MPIVKLDDDALERSGLGKLSKEDRDTLLRASIVLGLPPGEMVEEHIDKESWFLIVSGRVNLATHGEDVPNVLVEVGPGDWVDHARVNELANEEVFAVVDMFAKLCVFEPEMVEELSAAVRGRVRQSIEMQMQQRRDAVFGTEDETKDFKGPKGISGIYTLDDLDNYQPPVAEEEAPGHESDAAVEEALKAVDELTDRADEAELGAFLSAAADGEQASSAGDEIDKVLSATDEEKREKHGLAGLDGGEGVTDITDMAGHEGHLAGDEEDAQKKPAEPVDLFAELAPEIVAKAGLAELGEAEKKTLRYAVLTVGIEPDDVAHAYIPPESAALVLCGALHLEKNVGENTLRLATLHPGEWLDNTRLDEIDSDAVFGVTDGFTKLWALSDAGELPPAVKGVVDETLARLRGDAEKAVALHEEKQKELAESSTGAEDLDEALAQAQTGDLEEVDPLESGLFRQLKKRADEESEEIATAETAPPEPEPHAGSEGEEEPGPEVKEEPAPEPEPDTEPTAASSGLAGLENAMELEFPEEELEEVAESSEPKEHEPLPMWAGGLPVEMTEKALERSGLGDLSDAERRELMTAMRLTGLIRSTVVSKKRGVPPECWYLVSHGMIYLGKRQGSKNLRVATLEPGDWWYPEANNVLRAEFAVTGDFTKLWVFEEKAIDKIPASIREIVRVQAEARGAPKPKKRSETMVVKRTQKPMVAPPKPPPLAPAAAPSGDTAAMERLKAQNAYLRRYIPQFALRKADNAVNSQAIQKVLKSIPRLPVFVAKLLQLLEDNEAPIDEVVQTAQTDPSLVAEILKTVNSAQYGLPRRVDDFKMAITLLGFAEVNRITLAAVMTRLMPNNAAVREMREHCIAVSRMAYDLGRACELERTSMISVLGLLHQIGDAVVFVMKSKNPQLGAILDLLDRPHLGAALLREWQLPERLVQSIQYQEYPSFSLPEELPEQMSEQSRKGTLVLYLAHLCDRFLTGAEEGELPAGFIAEHLAYLGRPERGVRELVNKVMLPALKKHRFKFKSPLLEDEGEE